MMNVKELYLTWGMLLAGVIMNVCGAVVIKGKMNILGPMHVSSVGAFLDYCFSLAKYPSAVLGIIAILAAPAPMAVALSRMELAVAYPAATALNFLVLIPLTIFLLGESFTINKLLAIALITTGVCLLYK